MVCAVPIAKRFVMKQECTCMEAEGGCIWRGKVADLQEHFDRCSYRHIKCEMCPEMVRSGSMIDHINKFHKKHKLADAKDEPSKRYTRAQLRDLLQSPKPK
jgi:hypothetical protein